MTWQVAMALVLVLLLLVGVGVTALVKSLRRAQRVIDEAVEDLDISREIDGWDKGAQQ